MENGVRRAREAAGLTQQALAERCGVTRQAVNTLEAGRYVPSTAL
ncbi:MAG: helix-turn-helix domain-containing protein, partial [Deltaproteobacteria bacterium]|nr:helix-turn-helix domain-containing protein [Deltaproteobacteria bacterium]